MIREVVIAVVAGLIGAALTRVVRVEYARGPKLGRSLDELEEAAGRLKGLAVQVEAAVGELKDLAKEV